MPFGYSALISDVRATFRNGRPPLDGVQKIHAIGNGLIAGFAGSIKVGFDALSYLQRGWGVESGKLYPVHRAAWEFGHWWRRFYRRIDPDLRALGCELIVAGVSPSPNGPFITSRASILRAPDFEPHHISGRWASIGSGSQHKAAAEFANAEQLWPYYQMETSNPGGMAFSIAITVAQALDRDPMQDVSSKLLIGTARADVTEFSMLRREERGAWTIAKRGEPEPGELLATWREFEDAVGAADAVGAVAH